MKKLKRVLLLVLCLTLTATTPALAAETMHFGGDTRQDGDKVTVTLHVDRGGINSSEFELNYDPDKVTLESAVLGDAFTNMRISSIDTATPGVIKVGVADTQISEAGDMLIAEFTIKPGVEAEELDFPYTVSEVSNDVDNGLIQESTGMIGNAADPEPEETPTPDETPTPTPDETPTPTPDETPTPTPEETPNRGNQSVSGTITIERATEETSYTTEDGKVYRRLVRGAVMITGSEDIIPIGCEIVVEEVTSGETYSRVSDIVRNTLRDVFAFKVFNINLYNSTNSKITTLDGVVDVTMPVPAGFVVEDKKTIAAYYVQEDGTLSYCETVVKDGQLTFKTDRFGTFVLAQQDISAINSAKTSDTKTMPIAILMLSFGLLVAAYGVKKARA